MRTVSEHEDDIWPVVTVWLPTAIATYALVYKVAEWLLIEWRYDYRMPVEVCGGGTCDTIQMMAAGYYAGLIGLTAMFLVFGAWWLRSELVEDTRNT